MPRISPHFLELFDANGAPRGVLLSAELWERCKDKVLPPLTRARRLCVAAARGFDAGEGVEGWFMR